MKLPGLDTLLGRSNSAQVATPEQRLQRKIAAGGARFDRVVLTTNRRVMASIGDQGRTLRLSRVFLNAPDAVLEALGRTFSARTSRARSTARTEVKRYLQEANRLQPSPAQPPRTRRPQVADRPHLVRLKCEFDRVNTAYFGGRLPPVELRLSGRMRRRNGHFSADPLEIAISRRLCEEAAAGEAERTLRHEMIHLWQWFEGRKPGHGADFRRWARRLDIHPRATRSVCWTEAA